MPEFGKASLARRATICLPLQRVLDETIKLVDFSILGGWRDEQTQNNYYHAGTSNALWPDSDHNHSGDDYTKSNAADIMPYPVEWPIKTTDTPREYVRKLKRIVDLMDLILQIGLEEGVEIHWGGQYRSMFDGPHIYVRSP